MDETNEHEGKVHKPAKSHPWRNAVKSEVANWAAETSAQPKTNDWRVGGGIDPWNKR